MSSEGAIKRKLTINFIDGRSDLYTNEVYIWCPNENSITISDRYTGEFRFIYPYHVLTGIKQETIK